MPSPAKTILCIPFAPHLGSVERNRAKLLELGGVLANAGETPDLIVLPELALSGYLLESLVSEAAMTEDEIAAFARDLAASGLPARTEWILGFPLRVRGEVFNAAAVLRDGNIVHIQKKLFLPTYGMFDEGRYFTRGSEFSAFDGVLGKTAILICEDAWHMEMAYAASESGAENIVVISSSPGRGIEGGAGIFDSTQMWQSRLQVFAASYGQNYIYCNRSGVEDGILYDGNNFALDISARFVEAKKSAANEKSKFYELVESPLIRTGFVGDSARQNDLPLVQNILEKLRLGQ